MKTKKIKKILAPTDLSELSQAGVRYALNLARAVRAEVTIYHVVSHEEVMQYSKEIKGMIANQTLRPTDHILERYRLALERFVEDHFGDFVPHVKIHAKVELGRPDKNIVEEAEAQASDLIVISTHGRTGLSHVLMGSVTEKVVRHAPCPILSIRPQQREGTGQTAVLAA